MQLKIEKLIYGGDGLARLPADEHGPGKAVFVPFVISGETVETTVTESRSGFTRAKAERIISPSAHRIEPGCPYFTRCGGCHYQHIDYLAQLRAKVDILRETLRRTAKLELEQKVVVHGAEPWEYRNRTRMHVRHEPKFALGYFSYGSHTLLAVERCPISSSLINEGIRWVSMLGLDGRIPRNMHGVQFFANQDDTRLMVEAYVHPGTDPATFQPFITELRRLVAEIAGVIIFPTSPADDDSRQRAPLTSMHAEPSQAIGDGALTYHAAGFDYRVSGGSFFQTNRFLVDKLVEVVVGNRTGRAALDLYAGAGLFTLPLSRNFDQVFAVEASLQSFSDLRHNSPVNVKCLRMSTEAFLAGRAVKLAPDLIVVDPPRAGLGEKGTRALCRMSASHVTYVSCDPATLSRDLRLLLESGYRVEQAHLVDLFPQTYHMETVLHLAR